MSIDTENRQAIKTSERYALLTGLLLILLIVATPFWALPHLEDDLTARSWQALQEGLTDTSGIRLRFSGRSAEIVGPLEDGSRLQHAQALVQNVWGVTGVSTRAIELPRATAQLSGPPPSGELLSAKSITQPSEAPMTSDVSKESTPAPTQQPPETPPSATSTSKSEAQAPASTAPAAPPSRESMAETDLSSTQPETSAPEPEAPEEPTAAVTALPATLAGPAPPPEAPPMASAQAEVSVPGRASIAPEIADQHAPASAPAPQPEREAVAQLPPERESVEGVAAERPKEPAAEATPPHPEPEVALKPGDAPPSLQPGSLSRDDLLADWPRLARVHHLQIDIDGDRVRVAGEVDSLPERARIISQAPSYLPANSLDVNLSLVPRDAAQLAEYLNRLVIERFRFYGPGARFAVGAQLAMDRIAEVMNSYPHIRLGLVGFADPWTNPLARSTIARHRAAAAYHALAMRGVDDHQLLVPDLPDPWTPIGALYRPVQKDPHGQIQLFSLQGNYPWSIPPSKSSSY